MWVRPGAYPRVEHLKDFQERRKKDREVEMEMGRGKNWDTGREGKRKRKGEK